MINQSVEEAVKYCTTSNTGGGTSSGRDQVVPKPPMNIKYSIERGGQVVLLKWRPPSSISNNVSVDSFRVVACVCGGQYRTGIDQGTVTNLTTDSGELEYAISAQSRAGNDDLFRRGRFDVAITCINSFGESAPMTITIDFSRKTSPEIFAPSSTSSNGPPPSLKRHHTIC